MGFYRGFDQNAGHESNAEADLLVALQAAYARKELLETPFTDQEVTIMVTKPDFWFKQARVAVYLDGPYHRGVQGERDENIDRLLKRIDVTVLRYPYTPPLSKTKLKQIVSEVCEHVAHRYLKIFLSLKKPHSCPRKTDSM